MYRHVPNLLSGLRIFLIPFFIGAFYLPWRYAHFLAAFLFLLAAITDWFDGYLARRFQLTSPLGAFLDPVADKLLVSSALILIVSSGPTYLAIPAMIMIGREIAISSLREWMSFLGKRSSVAVNMMGKLKTTIQMIAILFAIVCDWQQDNLLNLMTDLLLYGAAVLTLWSMMIYLTAAWRELSKV